VDPNILVSFSTQNIVSKFGFMLVSCKVLREMTSVVGGDMSDGHLLALSTKARIPIVFRFIIEYSSLTDFGPLGNSSIFI